MSQSQWTSEELAHFAEETEETTMGPGEPMRSMLIWTAPDVKRNQATPASAVEERDIGPEAENAQWPK